MNGVLKTIDMLGNTIAALEEENQRLRETIERMSQRHPDDPEVPDERRA
jgi:hypothetical protein